MGNGAMAELVPRSENPDDRPSSIFESDPDPYDNPLALKTLRANEELEASELTRVGPMAATPSEFVTGALRIPTKGKLDNFSFKGREYLKAIYDSSARRRLLVAGRQVEKTVWVDALVSRADGALAPAGDIRVGDELATMSNDGVTMTHGIVSWVSKRYTKPCVRITTRQGHVVEVALTHPMRLWDQWVEAGNLKVGDRLAAVRRAGVFTGVVKMPDERVRLTAYLLGDGCLLQQVGFTSLPGKKMTEFLADLKKVGGSAKVYAKKDTKALAARLHVGPVHQWLEQDGLRGHKSATKFIPAWVFGLSRKQTALFLNRLWSTDGHVKKNGPSKYSIEYCSISKRLIKDVQALLWKFGIPSKIRENWPNIYKRRGEKKLAYILRVETQEGVRRFLQDVGAFTKSEKIKLPALGSNNNRDTYPKEVNGLIGRILASRGKDDWRENREGGSLHLADLRRTMKYAPTRKKLITYLQFFQSHPGFNKGLVDELALRVRTSDLYWDEIISIRALGLQTCVDFEVGGTHNFIAEGLVTHNSTLLGNILLAYSQINPYFRTLYVSPSNQQTKVFSRDRVSEPIELSPLLQQTTNSKLLKNVLEKRFVNRSQITLRFAFLNADRARGIPADLVEIDEFQDILLDNVPVIEECASHSDFKYFIYSGTPKSLDNSIEYYWTRFSTQNEWSVPCKRHGSPKKPGSWHWNILDEENIGEQSLICNKCGKQIRADDPDARWVALNPHPNVEKPFEGFRIPQLMVPWIDWSDIKNKQRVYSRAKFYNEVLGRSYDAGTRPLTRRDVQRNCWDELSMRYYREILQYSSSYPIYMGIDWGSAESSYTVVTLGGYLPFAPDRYTVFYWHRFEGVESEPRKQLEIIRKLVVDFNVQKIGADYGGGHWPNDELTRDFGADKVKKYQWVGNVKKKIKFEAQMGVPRHLCHRTEVMSDIFNAIKRGNVFWFPRWEEFEDPFAADMLNIYSEYNDRLRMNIYKAAPSHPDDSFHSLAFGFLASFYVQPRPDVILPTKEVQRQQGLTGTEAEEDDEMEDLDVV